MTIRTREDAIHVSGHTYTNVVGTCQKVVHEWYNAPSVGDVNGDGDADAQDGWESEPAWAKHPGDRNPPPGVPLSFLGGSHGYGHRAMSWPKGQVRSTDFSTQTQSYSPGVVGTAHSIEAVERAMGVTYAGWSETISGQKIPRAHNPQPPKPAPDPGPKTRGDRVDAALEKVKRAEKHAPDGSKRQSALQRAIKILKSVPFLHKRKK